MEDYHPADGSMLKNLSAVSIEARGGVAGLGLTFPHSRVPSMVRDRPPLTPPTPQPLPSLSSLVY
jgi:hypothetical protein